MIIDSLSNINRYKILFPEVARFLEQNDYANLSIGRHTISDTSFALVSEYNTIQADEFVGESHRKYIDFQLIVKGTETIRTGLIEKLQPHKPYDSEKDYELYTGLSSAFVLETNQFAVLYPGEAHQPMLVAGSENTVRKIVFKISCC